MAKARTVAALRLLAVVLSIAPVAALAQSTKFYVNPDSTLSPAVVLLCPADATHSGACSFGGSGGTSGGTATLTAPTYTNGQTGAALSLDLNGNLRTILGGQLPGFASPPTFNLGTSPLALESGGNLAASKADLDTLVARTNTLGQKLASQSVPVAIASDQVLPLPTGAATDATLGTIASKLDVLHADNGAASPTSLPPADATDKALIGPVTETPPASDTASSGLNGRLQRLAQDVTTLNATVTAQTTAINTLLKAGQAVVVSGTVTSTPSGTQAVSGTVTVANPTAQGLTDTQVRATPLPVSGTVVATGSAAEGTAPANPGVHVDGVDGGGLKRTLLTDSAGRLQVANTGFASSIADNADVALGAKADAAYTVGSATLIAIAKAIDRDTLLPLSAQSGAVWIGNVGQNGTWTLSGNLTTLQQANSTTKALVVGGAVADGNVPQIFSEVVAGIDAAGLKRTVSTDATGALTPPQAPSGSITQTVTAVSASTSTTIATALSAAIAVEIQCDGTAAVAIDRKGGTLTSLATAPLVLPATAYQLYVMPVATTAAITAWTATAQTCRVTQYARQ